MLVYNCVCGSTDGKNPDLMQEIPQFFLASLYDVQHVHMIMLCFIFSRCWLVGVFSSFCPSMHCRSSRKCKFSSSHTKPQTFKWRACRSHVVFSHVVCIVYFRMNEWECYACRMCVFDNACAHCIVLFLFWLRFFASSEAVIEGHGMHDCEHVTHTTLFITTSLCKWGHCWT